MPASPESTKTSLAQRLRAHATDKWPRLSTVQVRYRGQFAYIEGELADGERLPLMPAALRRIRPPLGLAIYLASKDGYQDQVWFTGSAQEALDLVCDLRDEYPALITHSTSTSGWSTPEGLPEPTT
jgi:hypothetical protein